MANVIPNLRNAAPVRSVFVAEYLAELARQALVAEAELTPKPGLVDRRGSGSHDDLSLDLMRRSASAVAPYFAAMARPRNPCRSHMHCGLRLLQSGELLNRRCLR
jgi:triphosphoribosyl-dephospho-CoA synthase